MKKRNNKLGKYNPENYFHIEIKKKNKKNMANNINVFAIGI